MRLDIFSVAAWAYSYWRGRRWTPGPSGERALTIFAREARDIDPIQFNREHLARLQAVARAN